MAGQQCGAVTESATQLCSSVLLAGPADSTSWTLISQHSSQSCRPLQHSAVFFSVLQSSAELKTGLLFFDIAMSVVVEESLLPNGHQGAGTALQSDTQTTQQRRQAAQDRVVSVSCFVS